MVAQEAEWQLGTPLPLRQSGREDPCSTAEGLIESQFDKGGHGRDGDEVNGLPVLVDGEALDSGLD